MSVVVAIKYKDGVAMAADRQLTWGNLKVESATKIAQMNYSGIGLGVVGSGILANLLEVIDDVVPSDDILKGTPITRPYIIKNIIPFIFDEAKKYNCLCTDSTDQTKYIDGRMMICTPDMINVMGGNGSLVAYDNFASIGCGDQLVHGYLSTLDEDWSKLKEDKAIKILCECIQKCCKDDVYIGEKTDILLLQK